VCAGKFAPPYQELIEKARWGERVRCAFCSSVRVVRCGTDDRGFQRYLCRECGRKFTARTGTIFDRSKLWLWEWFYMMRGLADGRSIRSIADDMQRPYNTVHRAAKRVRKDILAGRITSMLKNLQDE